MRGWDRIKGGGARTMHRLFGIAVAAKGLDGIIDLAGGAALLLVQPGVIAAWTNAVTQHELSEDPGDFLAVHLRQRGSDFGHSAQLFVAAYLLLHGAAKLLLAVSLLMGKAWAPSPSWRCSWPTRDSVSSSAGTGCWPA